MIRPISNRVLVQPDAPKKQTEGGLYLPDRSQDKPKRGVVLAVGPGKINQQGVLIPCQLKEGDVVLWTKYGGNPVCDEDDASIILTEDDILAVIESESESE